MSPIDELYLIVALSLLGGLAAAGVAELVDAVWLGRRRYPRRPR